MKCFICHHVAYCHFVSIAIIFSVFLSNIIAHSYVSIRFIFIRTFTLQILLLCFSRTNQFIILCILHPCLYVCMAVMYAASQPNEPISNYFRNSNSNSTMTQVFHALFNHYKDKTFVTFSFQQFSSPTTSVTMPIRVFVFAKCELIQTN